MAAYGDRDTYTMETEGATLYARWNRPAGMVLIPAKDSSFQMGSNHSINEQPVHTVTLSSDFRMDTTEVTQLEYRTLMASVYSGFV